MPGEGASPQGRQGRQLAAGQPAGSTDLELADRQRRAALGLGQQILVAPPALDGSFGLLLLPGGPAYAEHLVLAGRSRREEDRRAATTDQCPDRLAGGIVGQGGLPHHQRDLIPIDDGDLVGSEHFGRVRCGRVRSDRGGQLERPGHRGVFRDDDGLARDRLLENEPEVVVGRIGIRGDRHPSPAALLAPLERDAMVLQLALRAGQIHGDFGASPVDLELDGNRFLRGVFRPLAGQAERDQQFGAVAGFPTTDVGHPHRQVARRGLGIGQEMETNALRELLEGISKRCHRPLSAFQSLARVSEQIQTSVRPDLLALM